MSQVKKVIALDSDSFFKHGYSVTFLPSVHYQPLKEAVDNTDWVVDPDRIYMKTPSWRLTREQIKALSDRNATPIEVNREKLESCPGLIRDQLNKIISDPMIIGELGMFYRLSLDFVDLWDGVENTLGWHWDGPDQSQLISIIYLNGFDWPTNGGGDLVIGERDLVKHTNWLKDYRDVREVQVVPPAGRTQVWINNLNPRFVHKPKPLKDQSMHRLALTFGCSLSQA